MESRAARRAMGIASCSSRGYGNEGRSSRRGGKTCKSTPRKGKQNSKRRDKNSFMKTEQKIKKISLTRTFPGLVGQYMGAPQCDPNP
jgi:hypothetical protein